MWKWKSARPTTSPKAGYVPGILLLKIVGRLKSFVPLNNKNNNNNNNNNNDNKNDNKN